MKTYLFPILFIFLTLSCQSRAISLDKQTHFIAGALCQTVIYQIKKPKRTTLNWITHQKEFSFTDQLFSFGVCSIVGVIKEGIDSGRPNNKFDWEDVAANTFGQAAMIGISFTFDF